MKEALLILLAISSCLLAHIFMHKAMMGRGCHGHDHHSNETQKASDPKDHQFHQHHHSEELVALDKPKSEENK
ncbi:hypothetical protein ELD05_01895 [Caldicellulosiruptor changbaiensis]|uniref:DUF2933 domain-containing protein n=1 Tax=Caldicellulosiruptor changbaiensis TaxID=1222016 RepID=A0A3T0D3W5_9FIRM|nr:hypothetical protein [Caldicellulosiruptor changbaiensis]AZT89526.1 hypothetical protein ELD05_01895 [Caldicellulosiruptor changbaiensis]